MSGDGDPRRPCLLDALARKDAEFSYFPGGGPRFKTQQSHDFYLSLLPLIPRGSRLLDVGCGVDLGWREVLSAFEVEWSGVDVFEVEGRGPNYRRVVDDRIPHESASFDVVGLIDVLEHFVRPAHMLNEIERVLRPGGLLFGTSAFWQLEHDSYVHYSMKGVRALLEQHGFVVNDVTPSIHSGVMVAAQRFFGGGRVLRGYGGRALVKSVLQGLANAPIFYAMTALEVARKALPISSYNGRDDVDCASVYFRATKRT